MRGSKRARIETGFTLKSAAKGHVILRDIERGDLPRIASIVGKDVEIRCVDGYIGAIVEERAQRERNRGLSR